MDEMTQEPCDFVKLVLQRMDSNPEEFEHYGRWNSLCESLERYAGAYEGKNTVSGRNALWAYDQFEIDLMLAKYREIYRAREYKAMLKNLLVGVEPKAEGTLVRHSLAMQQGIGAQMGSGSTYQSISPQQLFANTATNSTATTAMNSAASIRSMMDEAIEAKMQGFKRG